MNTIQEKKLDSIQAKLDSIQEFRKAGYKVRVSHIRFYRPKVSIEKVDISNGVFATKRQITDIKENQTAKIEWEIVPKRGETTLEITTPKGKDYYSETQCSKKDPYCKKRAINILIGRIKKEMEIQ